MSFELGLPATFIEHIKAGVVCRLTVEDRLYDDFAIELKIDVTSAILQEVAVADPRSLLVFSGGKE